MSVSCDGKIRFETFARATRAARRSLRKGRDGRALAAYACRECRGFHVGTNAKTQASRERRAAIENSGQKQWPAVPTGDIDSLDDF